ncbi:fatty acyl-CoA reductase wat-like [Haematobia irritans]|uniref:fatty acyl-CoA reductase wat-like n=1 Tax=Haematobia irritans TaxID=7368 RepID=UPI003F4FA3C7
MESNIRSFFSGKVIFITGGTGFLGKVFLEKLLRTTDVKRIYLMIRPQDGANINERFEESILKSPLFNELRSQRPTYATYLKIIAGDCTKPDLAISNDDRQELIKNVDIIVHCAASVRFNELLSSATQKNIKPTLDLITLAKEIKQLQVFLHVSTAFVNCVEKLTEEKFYSNKLTVTCEQLLTIKDILGNENLDRLTNTLLDRFPNSYAITKAIAEEAIQTHGTTLPICIVRPGIIVPANNDPIPGWVEGLQGAVGGTYCSGMGFLRIVNGNADTRAALIPVDFCANIMMAAAWYTASMEAHNYPKLPTIFNAVPENINTVQWGTFWRITKIYMKQCPFSNMIWYPMLIFIQNKFIFSYLEFLYQTLPAYSMDVISRLFGKSPRMVKINRKMRELSSLLHHFIINDFEFNTTNTRKLWNSMTSQDQAIYNFDMASLNWREYLHSFSIGLRKYVAKEKADTILRAKQKWKIFYILNIFAHTVIFLIIVWILWILFK